jgi:hypothetical protein
MGYYSGDPGFFSVIKQLGGAALGLVPGGGIVKSSIRAAGGLLGGGRGIVKAAAGGIVKHPVLSAAGAAGALALTAGEAGRTGMFGRPRGKHPSARHLRALAMGLKRARPRMNVTNVHALRRSLRRAHGFAKLAMKTIHLVHPRKKARFGGFKGKRKR